MAVIHMLARAGALLAASNATNTTNSSTDTAPSLGLPEDMQQSWGTYNPWFEVEKYKTPPEGCKVVQVNLLQRHGARYPEEEDGKAMKKSVEKLKNSTTLDPQLDFLRGYNYSLGVSDLVSFGAAQSYDAGQQHFQRYESLMNGTQLPFVRASESYRVVDSALNWTAGFAHAGNNASAATLSVIIPESSNSTLDDKMCPGANKSSTEAEAWAEVFAPSIASRLNTAAKGANLTSSDVINLMKLCAFDTVANETMSPWCDLFEAEEWASFEYAADLKTFYGNGYGQSLGRVQGAGFVNELLARLTGQPVQDETQTNHTLDNSTSTFPLNYTFYADFTHDTQMISIFGALGLFNQSKDLEPKKMDRNRTWIASKMVPFSARMIVEKVTCDGKEEDYVRLLVNDEPQNMTFCDADGEGMCTLSAFVESQKYARENGEGDWEKCGFAGYNTTDTNINTQKTTITRTNSTFRESTGRKSFNRRRAHGL